MKSTTQKRREQGVCTGCKGVPLPECSMCGPCLAKANNRNLKRWASRNQQGRCADCGEEKVLKTKYLCADCAIVWNARQKDLFARIKEEVYPAYGGFVCACCGETMREALTIDHVDGGGSAHRRVIGRSYGTGQGFLRYLRRNDFPPGFQILCMNCQFGKKHNGGVCPHKQTEGV